MPSTSHIASVGHLALARHRHTSDSAHWIIGSMAAVLLLAALVLASPLPALAGIFAGMVLITLELGRRIARDAEFARRNKAGI